MTADSFDHALESFLSREPFHAFNIELKAGSRLHVDRPHAIAYRKGFAVHIGPEVAISYFDHTSVVAFIGEPASDIPMIAKVT